MKLLVIDDDTKLSVSRGLRAEGFAVEVAHTGDDGLWMATESSYDLIILDVIVRHEGTIRIDRDHNPGARLVVDLPAAS